jgi:uncharacterized membrane protein
MDRPSSTPDREFAPPAPKALAGGAKGWGPRGLFNSLRTQLISGLIFTLPIVITFWIVYWIFLTLERFLLNPVAYIIHRIHAWMRNYPAFQELTLPDWWYNIASPVLAIVLMLVILYGMGLFFRSWIYRTLDWLLLHVPIVATIYRAVRNVVNSLGAQLRGGADFKRVVLVPFPHQGARSLAFVTNSLHDVTTGRTILTVCVLTGVMPPAGFTLFVPEESVTNIAWSANDTLQAILSGGITAPPTIHFFEGLSPPLQDIGGPLVDVRGHTLRSVPAANSENAS